MYDDLACEICRLNGRTRTPFWVIQHEDWDYHIPVCEECIKTTPLSQEERVYPLNWIER